MYQRFLKPLLDFLFAILLTPLLLICYIVIKLIILFGDKGTVFYISERLGKNGKIFLMYKFRTMKMNAPDIRLEDGSTFNAENDTRVTKLGKILRKTSLDEIPQIINVLKGEMSFIGPRPDTPKCAEYYEVGDDEFLKVKPGITGYSQALFRNSIDAKTKIKNDIYYANHVSFWLDVRIILLTIKTIILRKNVYINKKEEIEHN